MMQSNLTREIYSQVGFVLFSSKRSVWWLFYDFSGERKGWAASWWDFLVGKTAGGINMIESRPGRTWQVPSVW